MVWSLFFFFLLLYLVLWSTILFYLLPNFPLFTLTQTHTLKVVFSPLSGIPLLPLLLTTPILLFLLLLSWSGPLVTAWYSHVIFTGWQYRLCFLILINFLVVLTTYSTTFYFASNQIYDFYITIYNFFFWILLLFTANNLFTLIFFIEVISTIIIMTLITSTFSSTFFYNSRDMSKYSEALISSYNPIFRSILFFFWISLLASLSLFLFLILYYQKILTFDWFLTESVFLYLLSSETIKSFFTLTTVWLLILFCFFLKCGLAPFFFWKPTFFKGVPLHMLFFYIFFYYFFLLFFIIHFFLVYTNELFFANSTILTLLLLSAILFSFFILFESYYIKSFLAISSILNTVLIFLGMMGCQTFDFALDI